MELYQMEYLREIARSGSLQAAAARLHISQPTLSRCVKMLEEEIGASLFDRVGRHIVLNQTGEIVLQRMNDTLEAAASIKRDADAFIRNRERVVGLYTPVPLGDDERVLFDFKRAHPEIRLRVGAMPAQQIMNETPDLMFFASPIAHSEPNCLKLGEERIVLAVPQDCELAKRELIALADMREANFIFQMPCALRDLCEGMFAEVGIEPRIIMENQWYYQVMHSVGLGYGYALVPSVTWFSSAAHDVVGVPISDAHRVRYLYLKWRQGAVLSEAAMLLRDHLVRHFASVCG